MQLHALLEALEQRPDTIIASDSIPDQLDITNLAYDSRKVEPGGLFIAVPGTHTDGRKYIAAAAHRGAVAALGPALSYSEASSEAPVSIPYITVENVLSSLADLACAFYGFPAQQLYMIGVTGTDGKTTTCNLTHTLLRAAGLASGLMTTANFKSGDREWENTTRQSTLESPDVQQFLRSLLDEGMTHAVIEATSHGLELQRVRGCAFDIGVVTNITHEHLDFHKTLANYRRAKARLFEMLDAGRDKGLGIRPVAILNRDDSSYEILKPYCAVPVLDYGIDMPAMIRAVDVLTGAAGTRFRVILPDAETRIETRLIGKFNVSNCLAAIAVAYSLGIAPGVIADGLAQAQGVTGRMERIDEGQGFSVIVDYAHTPDSLAKVLAILRPLTSGKLIVVFGSAGERDVQKRPAMGRIAAQMADFFVITDEDPREEDREAILRDIAQGSEAAGKREGRDFLCIADRTQAIAAAFSRARSGDTVLLAGKGHEKSIIIGREKVPWDDRRVAREQLRLC
jgi:UDP-N-acetylmuramoyl-L-alanyl-D-glutamate--2,6-diaminopimelate ligase